MSAMVVYGDDLYLAEGFPSGNLGKYDGKTWSIVVKGHEPFGTQNQGLFSLAVLRDRLYVNTHPKLNKGTQVWAYPFPNY